MTTAVPSTSAMSQLHLGVRIFPHLLSGEARLPLIDQLPTRSHLFNINFITNFRSRMPQLIHLNTAESLNNNFAEDSFYPTTDNALAISPAEHTDAYYDNLDYLSKQFSDKILFIIQEAVHILSIHYKTLKQAAKREAVAVKHFSTKVLIHRWELAKLITYGVK
jgi:hypothetical protein